jgi:hypothetical protein
MKFLRKVASLAAVSSALMFSSASNAATALGVTQIVITSAISDFLQISEVQAFDSSNTAVSFLSAVASNPTSGYGTAAGLAINGVVNQVYPSFYHSSSNPATIDTPLPESLTLTFSSAVDLSKLTIFGRGSDCCQFRDSYLVEWNGTSPGFGNIDSTTGVAGMITFTSAVPEPGEWAMMLSGLAVVGAIARRRRKSAA